MREFAGKYIFSWTVFRKSSKHLSWEDLRDADPHIVAAASGAWPEIRGLVRQRLADRLTSSTDSDAAPEVGRFLGSVLAASSGESESTGLLHYLDRLPLSDFVRTETIRSTAAYITSSRSSNPS